MTKFRRFASVAAVATLLFAPAACGDDEDGDGAETEEEVDQLDEGAEDVGNDLEQEMDEGAEEVEE